MDTYYAKNAKNVDTRKSLYDVVFMLFGTRINSKNKKK